MDKYQGAIYHVGFKNLTDAIAYGADNGGWIAFTEDEPFAIWFSPEITPSVAIMHCGRMGWTDYHLFPWDQAAAFVVAQSPPADWTCNTCGYTDCPGCEAHPSQGLSCFV